MPAWAFALTPRVPGAAASAGAARPGQADRRPQPGHRHAVHRRRPGRAPPRRRCRTGASSGSRSVTSPTCTTRKYWTATIARSPLESRPLPLELTPDSYVEDFYDYARVLGEGAPDVPLIGPAVAHPRVSLDVDHDADRRRAPRARSGERPPVSVLGVRQAARRTRAIRRSRACSAWRPRADSTKDIAGAVAVAHGAGLKFRLTELNSVTCGGKPGVSNTFATALWAPDALFTLMRAGVDGVNLHVRAYAINAPFSLNRRGPQPAAAAVRPDHVRADARRRCAPGPAAHVRTRARLNLSAWAVRVRGEILHVLLIDKSNRTCESTCTCPPPARATVQRLLAPSASSTTGETLDGQRLGPDGTWVGTRQIERSPRPHGYALTIPAERGARRRADRVGEPRRAPAGRTVATGRSRHRGAARDATPSPTGPKPRLASPRPSALRRRPSCSRGGARGPRSAPAPPARARCARCRRRAARASRRRRGG